MMTGMLAVASEGDARITMFGRSIGDLAHGIGDLVHDIWHAQLFQAGDSTIHLNQIIVALLVAVIGIWLSQRVAVLVRNRLSRIGRIDRNAVLAIQKVTYYMLVVIVVMIALPIAGIPITVFTILGGAIAIGVGFGAQNLFNNLISGMIIMTERPIRLGDIVEIGSNQGRIEEIGNRCTRLRRSDGVDVLVPNSHFLENEVINWTLADSHIRCTVAVGVAYGSPTREVERLLLRAVSEQERVSKQREVFVLFTAFGEDALQFEAFFWTSITRPLDRRRLESDIRYRVDELFRESGIKIAFPQRDVHLDSARPVQVRVVGEEPQNAV